MKVVVLGDLHIGVKNNSEVMFAHQKKFFDDMIEYMTSNGIDTIIQLGDVFDNRRQINVRTIQMLHNELFDRLVEHNIVMYSLVGNHDIYLRNSLETHSSGVLTKGYPNIHIIDTPTVLKMGSVNLSVVPWICESNYEECMKFFENDTSEYCVGHFEIGSFPVVGTILFEGGLDTDFFKKYKHVFSGHFHLRSEKRNITYVGTPYQLTWSDCGVKNGFVVFDTESGEYEFIENQNQYFHKIEFDGSDTSVLDGIDLTNSFVKLVVKDKSDTSTYNKLVDTILQASPTDFKIVDQELVDLQEMDTPQTIEVSDTLDLIVQYIEQSDLVDKESVKKYMVNLYREAVAQSF